MTDRPTPEQIARGRSGHETLMDLTDLGYVIVHSDELRRMKKAIIRATCNNLGSIYDDEYPMRKDRIDDIIAAAEHSTDNPKETS